jgi:hypothetical protein
MCVVTCVVSAARPARTPYLLSDRSLEVTVRHPKERRANFRCEALQSRKLNVYDYLGRLLIRHSRHQSEVYYAEGSIREPLRKLACLNRLLVSPVPDLPITPPFYLSLRFTMTSF